MIPDYNAVGLLSLFLIATEDEVNGLNKLITISAGTNTNAVFSIWACMLVIIIRLVN